MTIDGVKQYFENRNYECGPQTFPIEHTCRYGVTYECDWTGTYGEIWRAWDLMSKCCCWVCHNHNCQKPQNQIVIGCENVCEIWTNKHYCEK